MAPFRERGHQKKKKTQTAIEAEQGDHQELSINKEQIKGLVAIV